MQSQYHWYDKEILDLPLCNFRQKIELISQRRMEETRVMAKVTEWQTKSLANMLVGLAQDKDQGKSMVKMAQSLKLPMADEVEEDTRSMEQIMVEGAKVDLDKQPSMEQLGAALGATAR